MFAQRQSAELARLRAEVEDRRDLPWMRDVIATSLGNKIVAGSFTPDACLQLIVRRKRERGSLTLRRTIPPELDGLPTDVLRVGGELHTSRTFAPADAVGVGFGTALETVTGNEGTLGVVAEHSGRPVLLTAAHVAPPGIGVLMRNPPHLPLGVGLSEVRSATGEQLYGGWAANPEETFWIDLALVGVQSAVSLRGGLPGSHSFLVAASTALLVANLPRARVLSFGAASRGWHWGTVTGLWPRPTAQAATGLCLVQYDQGAGYSARGDSGGIWLLHSGETMVLVGMHWGLVGGHAWVTDTTAALRLAGVDRLWGDPTSGTPANGSG